MADYISPRQFHAAEGVEDWRVLGDGATAYFRTGSLGEAARLVQAISALPGIDHHPPDIDLRPDGVTVRIVTSDERWYGMSARDIERARQISGVARDLGLTADASTVQSVLVIPGASDIAEITPFWQVALAYDRRPDSPDEDLVDRHGRGPAFWFERMNELRADGRGAIHIAVYVPYDEPEGRIASALAAGGQLVRDEFAPSWWTLADAAGNEVDIATTVGRA